MFYLMVYTCITSTLLPGLHSTADSCQWDAMQAYAGEDECNRAAARLLVEQPFDGRAVVRIERHACVPAEGD